MSTQIGAREILFQDNFSTNGRINGSAWHFNEWQQVNNPSYYGLTQQRQELPLAEGGMVRLRLDTWLDGNAFSGSEAISKQLFGPGPIAFEAKGRFDTNQGGMIAGFFTFGGPRASHDEIDFEAVSKNTNQIQTNIYHNVDLGEGDPKSYTVTDSLKSWHTYRIEWLPNEAVRWLVDGTLVRTETVRVPDKPMALHLNIWGVPPGWNTGDPTFTPAKSANENKTYYFDVSSVKVEKLRS